MDYLRFITHIFPFKDLYFTRESITFVLIKNCIWHRLKLYWIWLKKWGWNIPVSFRTILRQSIIILLSYSEQSGDSGRHRSRLLCTLWSSKRFHNFLGDLDSFIFRMVKNKTLLFLKEQQKRNTALTSFCKENETAYYDPTEENPEEAIKKIDMLYKAIDKLPEKCRKVFLMSCLNDKTYQEIADELGTSINTVKTQMKSALKFLRENLDKRLFLSLFVFLTQKDWFFITLFPCFFEYIKVWKRKLMKYWFIQSANPLSGRELFSGTIRKRIA